MSDLNFYIAYYSCVEARQRLLYLLKRTIASARREKVDNLYVLDGSEQQSMLKPSEVDAEIIRNEKHSLACATNIAIEHAEHLMFVSVHSVVLGVGLIRNMLIEKEAAEKQLDRSVALCPGLASYPTCDKWFQSLPEHDVGKGKWVQDIKQELYNVGFSFTEDGIAISKEPRIDWTKGEILYGRGLGAGYLVDKDRLFEMGGADERCWCIDYDNGLRWWSFGWPIISSQSVKWHRLIHSTYRGCTRRYDEVKDTFYAHKKYDKALYQLYLHHQYKPIDENPSFYRDNLVSPYQEEYDRLKKKPFFLGRE